MGKEEKKENRTEHKRKEKIYIDNIRKKQTVFQDKKKNTKVS